jgi:hypothetical protein
MWGRLADEIEARLIEIIQANLTTELTGGGPKLGAITVRSSCRPICPRRFAVCNRVRKVLIVRGTTSFYRVTTRLAFLGRWRASRAIVGATLPIQLRTARGSVGIKRWQARRGSEPAVGEQAEVPHASSPRCRKSPDMGSRPEK